MDFSDEDRRVWQNATPNDRFIFAQIMQNEHICIGVLESFLKIEIDHLVYIKTEDTIDESYFSKGIRVDVYVKDEQGSIYNVEMQRENLKNLPQRSRYYQSLIDLNLLRKGEEYKDLRKSFIIFITNFDPFDRNRSVYRFANRDEAEPDLLLGDRTEKLFFNTRGKDKDQIDQRLRRILDFFDDHLPEKTSEDPFVQDMIDAFEKIKGNHELEVLYMTQRVYENDLVTLGYLKAESKYNTILKEKDDMLAEKDDVIAEKDDVIAEKEDVIAKNYDMLAKKDEAIALQSDQIEELKAMVRELMSKVKTE